MERLHSTEFARTRRTPRAHAQLVPVAVILVLLGLWFLIGEWQVLPELIKSAFAALS